MNLRYLAIVGCLLSRMVSAQEVAEAPKAAEAAKPPLQLRVFQAVAVAPGSSVSVECPIERSGFDEPVTLKMSNLPEGVTVKQVTIPAGAMSGMLEIVAASNATPRVRSAIVSASGGTATASDVIVVRVSFESEKLPPGTLDYTLMKEILEDSDSLPMLRRRGSIGGRFTTDSKRKLADFYGGTPESEAAVMKGLAWLAKMQQPDGSWSLKAGDDAAAANAPPTASASETMETTAGTAFGLLPFLAEGITHRYSPAGQPELKPYRDVVKNGLVHLASRQVRNQSVSDGSLGGNMYAHALGTIALCETYGLSGDPKTRVNAQLALKYLLNSQHQQGGGWRYGPGQPGDMSVTSWVFLGIRSAQLTGIPVLEATLERAGRFVDSCASGPSEAPDSRYTYVPGEEPKLSLTAAGLLTRQYLGWDDKEPDLLAGCAYLMENRPPDSATTLGSMYYYYYATQVLHHLEGPNFDQWNHLIREHILRQQEKDGDNAGSWNPTGVDWGKEGGRMYATGLAILTLQAPYRHLPMFRQAQFSARSTKADD
ncbi:MAG: prenyltransferase/squalene oxidase repeat-containing protein [Planctomycetaceae bacterium]